MAGVIVAVTGGTALTFITDVDFKLGMKFGVTGEAGASALGNEAVAIGNHYDAPSFQIGTNVGPYVIRTNVLINVTGFLADLEEGSGSIVFGWRKIETHYGNWTPV